MKERPILFSAAEVRALLAGRKTQTRRAVKWPSWLDPADIECLHVPALNSDQRIGLFSDGKPSKSFGCPYGQPGDTLWVRETWAHDLAELEAVYRATWECRRDYPGVPCEHGPDRWRSPMHMPRWASRISLRVTSIRVERLQEIGKTDAIEEGWPKQEDPENFTRPLDWYREYWESVNGAGSWAANPWVWVLDFEVIR